MSSFQGALGAGILAALLGAGCVFRPPILLETAQAPTKAKTLPFKAGIRNVTFDDPSEVSDCFSIPGWMYVIPIQFVIAQFPNVRDETLYIRDSLLTYFRDVQLFKYTYAAPYDPEDVDVYVDFHFDKFVFGNNTAITYEFFLSLPGLNLGQLFLPLEFYYWNYTLTAKVYAKDGTEIGKFTATRNRSKAFRWWERLMAEGPWAIFTGLFIVPITHGISDDWVWVYEEPWGRYLWYKGEFKKDYFRLLEDIRNQMESANLQPK